MTAAPWIWDHSVRRSRNGEIVSGGHPPRVLRLSERGSRVLTEALADAARADAPTPGADAAPADAAQLLGLLARYEMLHPRPAPDRTARGRVTVVIPAHNAAGRIGPLVAELVTQASAVIVVDDGSTDDTARVARDAGARVVARADCEGPAAARNDGLAAVETALAVFLDDDCEPALDWVDELAPLFADERLAIAAPRVVSAPGASLLERYEQACSPLDLGVDAGIVGPGRRVSYVPSAAWLVRVAALRELGGFDGQMRVGEDVDLVWRLSEAGWRTRYVPSAVVVHRPRTNVAAALRQRFRYGRSTATLEGRHPGAARPLYVTGATVVMWLAAVGGLRTGATGFAVTAGSAALRTRDPATARAAVGLAARGHAHATRHLARLLARDWLPLTIVAALLGRRLRRLAALALAADVFASRLPLHLLPLRIADNAAHAAGQWVGVLDTRSTAALRPRRLRRRLSGEARS